ncbi:MAG: hypothetical protein Q8Q48_01655 [Candidatus Staskawiczbacteria bacterium]|nr:hypothetical protein [Candidatus Staskawiczbacteria bacterium]
MSESIKDKIEDKIIDWAVRGAGDRLVIFKPEGTGNKADLVAEKKGEYEIKEDKALGQNHVVKTQIFGKSSKKRVKKLNIFIGGDIKIGAEKELTKKINIEELKHFENCYLIFTFFNTVKQDLSDYVCLVDLKKFEESANATEDTGVKEFKSFLSPDKKDKFSDFLLNKKDLSQTLFNIISAV